MITLEIPYTGPTENVTRMRLPGSFGRWVHHELAQLMERHDQEGTRIRYWRHLDVIQIQGVRESAERTQKQVRSALGLEPKPSTALAVPPTWDEIHALRAINKQLRTTLTEVQAAINKALES